MAADPTRRAVLAAAAASLPLLAVSGCKGVGALATPPKPAPDVAVLRSAIAAEETMIARYDAVIARSASLAVRLRPLRAEHRLHLAQLRSRLIVPPASAAAASPSPHGPSPHGPSPHGPSPHPPDTGPAGTAAAISFLQAAESAAATTLLRQLAAVSPSLAQLMASVAASEATHASALAAGGGGAPMTGTTALAASAAEVSALQAALRAEHAAVYGYGVVGAHLTGAALAAATSDWIAHQVARDSLEAMLRSAGQQPAAAAVAYRLPHAVHGPATAMSLAVTLENRVAAAYLAVVALPGRRFRELGARGVTAAAIRAASWRGKTVAFPGFPAGALSPAKL